MRYFVPDIRVADELEAQRSARDKFGGLPWGLKPSLWPKCADCGKSQSFLAQFVHDPIRLDLGRPGRMLYIFQCNHDPGMCATWDGRSGANACFVVEPERLTSELAKMPSDKPVLENEVFVVQWHEHDDGLSVADAASYYDDDKFNSLPEEQIRRVTSSTRLGGVPCWIQSPSEAPSDVWRFVGQLDSTHSFLQAPKRKVPWVHSDEQRWEGRTHCGEGPNFGDGGMAYLFVRSVDQTPQGWLFWQCG